MRREFQIMQELHAVRTRSGRCRIRATAAALLLCASALSAAPQPGDRTGGRQSPVTKTETPLPARVEIRGRLRNGTRGTATGVPKLELIDPSGGMRPIASLSEVGPTFRFGPVKRPEGPLLLRAHYLGETYITLVPPAPRFWNANHVVEVFDAVPLPADVEPRAALQVSKEKGRLLVSRIVAIHNKTRTTYRTDTLIIPVPKDAVDLRGSLQQEGSRMPVPLQLQRTDEGVRIGRGIRPGNAAITLEYSVPGTELRDSLPRNLAAGSGAPLPSIIWWRPSDARPRVTGAKAEDVDTGNLGPALRVHYPRTEAITFDFSAGGFAPPAVRSEANPIFASRGTSLLGVILFALTFFALAAVAVGSGFRLVRASLGEDAAGSGGRGQ